MAIQCNSESDCTTGQLCVNNTCSAMNAENIATRIPSWGWAVIALALVLIIMIFVRCCCWPSKNAASKKSSLQKDNGPAPLPKNYMKPVDLMAVADANKKVENSIILEQQKQVRMHAQAAQFRKGSNDSTVYPGSSISQTEYDTYQMDGYMTPYHESQPQYGFQPPQAYYSSPLANQNIKADPAHHTNNLNVNRTHPNLNYGNYDASEKYKL